MHIIHHIDELLAALASGERELCTSPNALGYLGAGYLAAMMQAARAEYPHFTLWCDAGDDAGAVMAALRSGLTHITVQADAPVLEKLQQMAGQVGAAIEPSPSGRG